MFNNKVFIYRIECVETHKNYIGSTINFENRKKEHLTLLKNNKHHSKKLQYTYNKYGKKSFKFEILATCPIEYRVKLEQWFLNNKEINSELNGSRVVVDCSVRKRKLTPQNIIKIIEMLKDSIPISKISHTFNISDTIIYDIRKNKDNIVLEYFASNNRMFKPQKIESSSYSNFKDEDIIGIINDMNEGNISPREICNKYNISMSTYQKIKTGKTWKHLNYLVSEEVKKKIFKKVSGVNANSICNEYFTNKISYRELALKYNISTSMVGYIITKHKSST